MAEIGAAQFHVLYWEAKEEAAITFGSGNGGPSLCRQCQGIVRPWRYRLDNLQACIRSCGKEGTIFRPEIADFVCLSPCLAIRYELSSFASWLGRSNQRALTETVVLRTPMKVQQGNLKAEDCGVSTTRLGSNTTWESWFLAYIENIRKSVVTKGRRAIALFMDGDGTELLTLGAALPRHHVDSNNDDLPPIGSILLFLGGPDGIKPDIQASMEFLLSEKEIPTALVCLPGGKQHSNVVLADLFMSWPTSANPCSPQSNSSSVAARSSTASGARVR